MTEKFLSTLLLMFISLCYLIYNARRDTALDKELDVAMQMTLKHVLVQRFKRKKKWTKKITFNIDIQMLQNDQITLEE